MAVYGLDEAEKSYLDSLKSWRFESVAWHAYGKRLGSVPMRRFLSKQTGIHHYSCDILEGAVLADNPVGWMKEFNFMFFLNNAGALFLFTVFITEISAFII